MKKIFLLFTICALAACNGTYNKTDVEQGGPDAPFYNERTNNFMLYDNDYANIDSYKPKDMVKMEQTHDKWNTSRMETHWQEYRGTMIRVQVLLGNSDLREMRLRIMQNADGMDIDGDARTVLAKVADYEMKRVCGRNAINISIVYDKPSFDVMRPTPYFDYKIEAEGAIMREYGFRCMYEN